MPTLEGVFKYFDMYHYASPFHYVKIVQLDLRKLKSFITSGFSSVQKKLLIFLPGLRRRPGAADLSGRLIWLEELISYDGNKLEADGYGFLKCEASDRRSGTAWVFDGTLKSSDEPEAKAFLCRNLSDLSDLPVKILSMVLDFRFTGSILMHPLYITLCIRCCCIDMQYIS